MFIVCLNFRYQLGCMSSLMYGSVLRVGVSPFCLSDIFSTVNLLGAGGGFSFLIAHLSLLQQSILVEISLVSASVRLPNCCYTIISYVLLF